jgi:hypothetical protein
MVEGERKNWRELCRAALEARDPDELSRKSFRNSRKR